MSVRLISEVLRTPLGTSQKMVLLVLADAASEDGVAWPRQSTISTRASLSDRSVRRILDELAGLDLVSWEQRGLRRSNMYQINVAGLRALAELGDDFDDVDEEADTMSVPDSPERTPTAGPDRTRTAGQERTPTAGPKGTVRGTAREEPKRDEIFETLCRVCGIDWTASMTRTQRGRINAAAKEIREIGGTPDEILRVAAAYRIRWPEIDVTPQGIVGNWNLVRAPLPGAEDAGRARRSLLTPPGRAADPGRPGELGSGSRGLPAPGDGR